VNGEERKIDCKKYSECLDKVAKGKGQTLNCAGCESYEKLGETRVDEFEEELRGQGERGEEEMRQTLNVGKKCSVEGCEKEANAGGLCWMHFRRKQRGADMLAPRWMKPGRKPKEKKEESTTDKQKQLVRATGKKRGAYKPKGPKAGRVGDNTVIELSPAAKELLRHEKVFDILEAAGILKREQIAAAFALVKE
jgi:hypothetical protein